MTVEGNSTDDNDMDRWGPSADNTGSLPRLAVLISGYGSNLQAIIDAVDESRLTAVVAVVVSDHGDAFGLERARKAGIPALCRPFAKYRGKPDARRLYDADLADEVAAFAPDLIVLAGWMRLLGHEFLDRFPEKVINLHPALPGTFPGAHAIAEAFAAAQAGEIDHTGVMVHYVVPEMDAGPVIDTRRIAIEPVDTVQSLEERIHAAEHELLIQAIDTVLRSRIVVDRPGSFERRQS